MLRVETRLSFRTRATLALMCLGLTSGWPAFAQKTSFEPRITALWNYTDNVRIISAGDGTSGSNDDTSDSYTNLEVWLPVVHRTRFGSVAFNYTARYYKYNRGTQYDNLAHLVNFNLTRNFNRGGSLAFDVYGGLTQDQSVPQRIDDPELFLTVRTNRRLYGSGIRFDKTTRRDYWRIWVRGARSEYTAIEGTLPDQPPEDPDALRLIPEDRIYVVSAFDYRRRLTRRFSIGPRYDFRFAELERSRTEKGHLLGLYPGWTVSEYFSFGLTVGGFSRQRDGSPDAGIEQSEETSWFWTIEIKINPPIAAIQKGKVKLDVNIGIQPTGGGALEGTSTNSFAWVYLLSGTTKSPWSWRLGTRYTRRDSTIESQPTYQAVGLNGGIERTIAKLLSIRFGAGVSQQISSASGAENAAFGTLNLGLVVYPLGRGRSTSR